MTNSTVTGNFANTDGPGGINGGGLSLLGGAATLHNSIVAGNFSGTDEAANDFSGTAVQSASSFNLIGDAGSAGGLSDGSNGNIVGVNGAGVRNIETILQTRLDGGPVPSHKLVADSPAIDAGDSSQAVDETFAALTTDQRGYQRVVNSTVDIGAVEWQNGTTYVVDTIIDEPENGSSMTDGFVSLREAIKAANTRQAFGDAAAASGPDAASVITFDDSLAGMTITLGGTELTVSGDLKITGLGADQLTISGNNASRIFRTSSGSTVEISDLTLTEGNAGQGNGGAIYTGGPTTLRRMYITGNTTGDSGGGLLHRPRFDELLIVDSTITGNSAFTGGGLTVDNALIINSTISGNSAIGYGGGILVDLGTTTLINTTVTGNRTTGGVGGGLSTFNDIHSSIFLQNSIVAGNFSGTGTTPDDTGSFRLEAGSNFNLIGEASPTSGLVNGTNGNIVGVNIHDVLDPVLRDNGGPTKTHALIPDSPAINRGNNALAVDANMNPLTTDQRGEGFARIITRVDIGAFEGFLDPMTSFTGFFNGNWWLAAPDADGVYDTNVAASGPASTFQKVLTGDFNGDGHDDLAAWLLNGQWRVGLNDGDGSYNFTTWTTWTGPNIKEVHVGDFNNDGLDDIIGLFEIPNRNRGRWWVGLSDGTRFANRNWGDFGNFSGLLDVVVGNFDGVKGDDLALITATGNIFMGKTSNSSFQYLFSHNWSVNSGFNFFQSGDFNGDGRDDLIAVFGNGTNRSIFVAKSLGPAVGFASLKFSDLTATQSLDSFMVGDFNGDGKDDVAARLNTTKWWLGLAGVNVFNFTFGTTWSFASSGVHDIHVGSTNGDANSDILGRDSKGNWIAAESNGSTLSNRIVENWAPVNWQFVNGGDYSVPPTNAAMPLSPQAAIRQEVNSPDLARRWSGRNETPSATDGQIELTQPSLQRTAPAGQESEDYDAFGDADLLDLLYVS